MKLLSYVTIFTNFLFKSGFVMLIINNSSHRSQIPMIYTELFAEWLRNSQTGTYVLTILTALTWDQKWQKEYAYIYLILLFKPWTWCVTSSCGLLPMNSFGAKWDELTTMYAMFYQNRNLTLNFSKVCEISIKTNWINAIATSLPDFLSTDYPLLTVVELKLLVRPLLEICSNKFSGLEMRKNFLVIEESSLY